MIQARAISIRIIADRFVESSEAKLLANISGVWVKHFVVIWKSLSKIIYCQIAGVLV